MIKSLIILLLTFSFFGYGQELKISAGSVMNIYNKERVWGGYFENISSFYGNINYEHKLRKFGVSYSLSIMSIKQEFTYDFFIPKTTDNIENIYLEFGLSPVFKPLDKLNIKHIGSPYFVSYNSPYKVFNRRNEVMIKVEYKTSPQ